MPHPCSDYMPFSFTQEFVMILVAPASCVREVFSMLRWLSAAFALALFFSPLTSAQDKAGPVQISWHGQSFFTVKSTKGTVIVIDPHQIPEYGRLQGLKADAVLMSHLHND